MLPDIDCVGCGACANACSKNCLNMIADKNGFLHPEIKMVDCINCKACERVCPIINKKTKEDKPIPTYAVYSKNDDIRNSSSSGGLFYTVAKHIIENGGIVYGAAFDEDLYLSHKSVESLEDLHILQGSKYIQSDTKTCFKEIKNHLTANKFVLFCGTPCQVEALLCFLEKPYENLFTLDFICHGVPSPKVWREYVGYRSAEANGAKPRKIAFRAKNEGWKRYSVSFQFENDTEYVKISSQSKRLYLILEG